VATWLRFDGTYDKYFIVNSNGESNDEIILQIDQHLAKLLTKNFVGLLLTHTIQPSLTLPATIRYPNNLFSRISIAEANALTTTFSWHGNICCYVSSGSLSIDAAFCDELFI